MGTLSPTLFWTTLEQLLQVNPETACKGAHTTVPMFFGIGPVFDSNKYKNASTPNTLIGVQPSSPIFTELALLGRFSHRVSMSVRPSIRPSIRGYAPLGAVFFKAFHWPLGHMISSRPLIGPPTPTTHIFSPPPSLFLYT